MRARPLGRVNRELRHIAFLLRKYRGKIIFVAQRSKDIEGTFRAMDIWLATFRKFSKRTAILYSNIHSGPILFRGIPRTTVKFDTYDIASFELESADFQPQTQNQEMLKAWIEHGNYRKITRQFNLRYTQDAKRIIREEVKNLITQIQT